MIFRSSIIQIKTDSVYMKAILVFLYFLSFLSFVLLCLLAFEGFFEVKKSGLEISSEGFRRFLDYFLPFKDLLGSTVAVIGLYLIIRQVQIMSMANKISNWIDWRDKFETTLKNEIGISHSTMVRYFEIHGQEIHEFLFNSNMAITNKTQLTYFFKKFIANGIVQFEQNTTEYLNDRLNNSSYQYVTCYSYFGYFKKISEVIARPNIYYPNLSEDLKELYFIEVEKYRQLLNH